MKMRENVNKSIYETNKFFRIASIGKTMWVHTSLRFMTNLEIVIEDFKKQFFCPLWGFRENINKTPFS